jgi:beta-galactosidase
MQDHGPWSPIADRIFHGGDYNPDQWQHAPEVLEEDIRLMQQAGCNAFSLNIFGWTACEPEEGRYTFEWLDATFARLHAAGIKIILATPSGAKPAWMAQKYPEIRRTDRGGQRQPYMGRHNCCFNSPVWREKTQGMARKLAERYGRHPALLAWHVNNEYNAGECHCNFCYDAFRAWLKQRYKTLEALNLAWWNHFWSHAYTDWSQIEPLDPENVACELDWRRFISDSCVESFKNEAAPLRELTPDVPVTTNLMANWYNGLDYWKLAGACDFASWDAYPIWGQGDDAKEAAGVAFAHDVARSYKAGRPFVMMESTPSGTNWMDVCKLKRPGQHAAASLQALAHGSDTVLYFQWRKGSGGFEQHHGAVVDHDGSADTRVFQEVAALGKDLAKLSPILGASTQADVAMLWDWENHWAVELFKGVHKTHRDLDDDVRAHYFELWRRGVAVDAVSLRHSLKGYKLLIAPWLYMVPQAYAHELRAFVEGGGTIVTGFMASTVDESGLCHRGGRPGLLREVFGLWAEETDALYDFEEQAAIAAPKNLAGLKGRYAVKHIAEHLHLEGAQALARFGADWLKGKPAVTVNRFGQGRAYYLGARLDGSALSDLYAKLLPELKVAQALPVASLPEGVEASLRGKGEERFLFLVNHRDKARRVPLGKVKGKDLLSGKKAAGTWALRPYGAAVIVF